MSKGTSINNLSDVDMNVSQEINNVLAEIETSRNNEMPQQQQMQQMQQMPQMIQQMPPNLGQQLPPPQQVPQQYIQQQNPNYYQNFPIGPSSNGILEFFQNFMIMGDELKLVALIAGLFFVMNMSQTKNMLGKYLQFTINELGDSTMIGLVARGLILGLIFVIINKFI